MGDGTGTKMTPIELSYTAYHRAERQSARMAKNTNDGLTRSGKGCFIAVPIMTTVGVKGLLNSLITRSI